MLRGREAFRAYADVEWRGHGGASNGPGPVARCSAMRAWVEAVAALPGRPGSFPEDERSSNGDGGGGGGGDNDNDPGRGEGGRGCGVWALGDPLSVANIKRARESRRL